jgi:hypothetical protein
MLAACGAALAALTAASEARAQNVTPFPCAVTQVTTGNTAVNVLTGPVNGAVIWNPAGQTTSPLYLNQTATSVASPTLRAATTSDYPLIATASAPSQPWLVVPHSRLGVSVISTDSSHPIGCLQW